jgi:hypothetical protein
MAFACSGVGSRGGGSVGLPYRLISEVSFDGAYLDAILAGANEFDASDIAKVIERRPRPSYEERMAVFSPTGRPEPSSEPLPRS